MAKAKTTRYQLRLGGMAPSIESQLDSQGLAVPHVERYQKAADAITLLFVQGLLTDGETKRARGRLIKKINGKLLRFL